MDPAEAAKGPIADGHWRAEREAARERRRAGRQADDPVAVASLEELGDFGVGAFRRRDRYIPVETDEEPARENGRRTDKRSMAGFDPA
jgi:hypothetical protein